MYIRWLAEISSRFFFLYTICIPYLYLDEVWPTHNGLWYFRDNEYLNINYLDYSTDTVIEQLPT